MARSFRGFRPRFQPPRVGTGATAALTRTACPWLPSGLHEHALPPPVPSRVAPDAPVDGDDQPGRGDTQPRHEPRPALLRRRGAPPDGAARGSSPSALRARRRFATASTDTTRSTSTRDAPPPRWWPSPTRTSVSARYSCVTRARGRVSSSHARGGGRPRDAQAPPRRPKSDKPDADASMDNYEYLPLRPDRARALRSGPFHRSRAVRGTRRSLPDRKSQRPPSAIRRGAPVGGGFPSLGSAQRRRRVGGRGVARTSQTGN